MERTPPYHRIAGGEVAKLPTNLALLKGGALIGVDLRQFGEKEPAVAAANLAQLFVLAHEGALTVQIGACIPIDHFADAMRAAADRGQAGRVVLNVGAA